MNKKRKILGMTAAIAVIVGLLMVSVPAEEKEKTDNDCGCGCNKAPAQDEPLNFNKVLEKTVGWENDVEMLEKEIKEKKEELLELYKKTKKGVQCKEIEDLELDIAKLEAEYWYKKEVLFEIEVIQKYTEMQRDGTLKIVKDSLPQIKDLDFEVSKALNSMEFAGREKMEKKSELYEMLFGEKYWKRDWNNMGNAYVKIPGLSINKIEKMYWEIEDLDVNHWNYRKEYIELRTIQKIKEDIANGRTTLSGCYGFWCDPPTTPLDDYGYYNFYNFQKVKVWVGMYKSEEPSMDPNDWNGEKCYTYFTTDMNWYWTRRAPGTKSIQVKWFYLADVYEDSTRHNIIWEGNKNSSREWYTYYGKYTTTNPKSGSYQIKRYLNHHGCCGWIKCHWCNTHCGGCFACDPSRAQYFSRTDTKS